MPLKLFRRKTKDGGYVWHCRGQVADDYIRRSLGTADKKIAARIASEIENQHHKRHLDGPQEALTFPVAVILYQKAGKGDDRLTPTYIAKLTDYWKNTKVKDMTPGAIRQSAIEIYPGLSGATWNRQVITPTQAIINHCAELEHCPPIRVKRYKFEKKIKKPVTVEWLDIFCAHADKQMIALATFMFATGCRISEARRLDWPDIDFNQRTILIQKTKAKQARMPNMPARLLVALANLPRDKKPFADPEMSMRRTWDEAIIKAAEANPGFERLTFHSCRHGLATKLLRDGVDPRTAADLVGMTVQVLITTYAHALKDKRITDNIFSTPMAREESQTEQNQQVVKDK